MLVRRVLHRLSHSLSRSILGAPHRRTIYLASLEAHIDRIHAQLSECGAFCSVPDCLTYLFTSVGCCPVSVAELEPFRGLNSKTAKVAFTVHLFVSESDLTLIKSMVSGLQHEVSVAKLKLLELERAVGCFA